MQSRVKNTNLYESGESRSCIHRRPGKEDADELFVSQEMIFCCPGSVICFSSPSLLLSFSAVSQVAVKGRGKAFPSEQRSAIKHRVNTKRDGYKLVRPLVIYTGAQAAPLPPLSFQITCSIKSGRAHLSIGLLK